MTLPPHTTCRQSLINDAAEQGLQATVTMRRPLDPGPNTVGLACPHGIAYWVEFTGRTGDDGTS